MNEEILYLFPFLSAIRPQQKKRPAVVIRSNLYNEISQDIIIMAITSRTEKSTVIGEGFIENWKTAGLLKPSTIKPAISTIEENLVLKRLGKLSPRDIASLDNVLRRLINL